MTRAVDRFWGIPAAPEVSVVRAEPVAPTVAVELLDHESVGVPSAPVRVEIPGLRPVPGEPIVRARTATGETVALVARAADGGVQLGFDPDDAIARLVARHALSARSPASARLPFHYHRIPAPVREVLRNVLTRRQSGALDAYPAWPIEPSVEAVRRIYLAARQSFDTTLEPAPFWPEGKRWAVLLSHDIDSRSGLTLAPEQAAEEAQRGLASAWYVVGRRYALDGGALAELEAIGMELGLHGDTHDSTLAFVSPEAIAQRLDQCQHVVERYRMRGFRSPSMLRTAALYDVLRGRFAYDSSMPDTGLLPSRNGCASVFPIEVQDVLVVPLTLPPDGQLLSRGLGPDAIVAAWIAKAEWVRAVGGVAFHLTHPERGFSASPRMRETVRRFLDWVTDQGDAWHVLPADLAAAWQARATTTELAA
jgi:peptidoglycan/xylan/chitin deacetylase (PgdA/CDA1 family)